MTYAKKALLAAIVWAVVAVLEAGLLPMNTGRAEETDRIWIRENGEYVPFLVLGRTVRDVLVIREHTTGPCAFSYTDSIDTYYAESALDAYLNTEYAERFSGEASRYFLESDIEITARSSIGYCGGETEYIRRVFFSPSWTETTGRHNSVCPREGTLFSERFTRLHLQAVNDAGEPSVWWLRTPDTWYFNLVLGIGEDGGVSTETTVDGTGVYAADVRPVFRISVQAPMALTNGEWYLLDGDQD